MKKFVCTVCGYVHEGDAAPEKCPVCGVGADKFKEQAGEKTWAAEHVVGVAKGVSEDIVADLRANFEGECASEFETSLNLSSLETSINNSLFKNVISWSIEVLLLNLFFKSSIVSVEL